jgi:hypothetical protein
MGSPFSTILLPKIFTNLKYMLYFRGEKIGSAGSNLKYLKSKYDSFFTQQRFEKYEMTIAAI